MRKENQKFFAMKIDTATRKQLEELARSTERTASGYIRWLIRREYVALKEDGTKNHTSNISQ